MAFALNSRRDQSSAVLGPNDRDSGINRDGSDIRFTRSRRAVYRFAFAISMGNGSPSIEILFGLAFAGWPQTRSKNLPIPMGNLRENQFHS
jgi:hypothetical protein